MRAFVIIALLLCFSITTLNAAEKTVVGTVEAIDATKNSITVNDITLDVTRKSQITVDGRKARLEDIKADQPARVTYDDSLEVAISITVGEGSDDDEATRKDMKSIQGEWKCVSCVEDGIAQDKDTLKRQNRRATVKGNSLRIERTKGDTFGAYVGKFEIDASTGHFDWIGKGPKEDLVEWIGIYELDGDELKLCYFRQKNNEATRPTEFKPSTPSKQGTPPHVLCTFKRDND